MKFVFVLQGKNMILSWPFVRVAMPCHSVLRWVMAGHALSEFVKISVRGLRALLRMAREINLLDNQVDQLHQRQDGHRKDSDPHREEACFLKFQLFPSLGRMWEAA